MSSVVAVVCALHLCTGPSHRAPPPDTLAVRVTMTFDPARISASTMRAIKHESEAIWSAYGVVLLWSDDRPARAALNLVVVIDRDGIDLADRARPELAHTTLDGAGFVRGPIHISLGAIEALIPAGSTAGRLFHDHALAMAAGRVLAHEIGHVLLGPPAYHDAHGLMRATFPAADLCELNRGQFRLSSASVSRLGARLKTLSARRDVDSSTRLAESE